MQEQSHTVLGSYLFNPKYCIGQGSFGKVYKGRHIQTQQTVAIKQLDRSIVSEEEINKQIDILKSLVHPNIVKYEAALKTAQFFYIITEYCNGGDLHSLLDNSDIDSQQQQNNLPNNQNVEKIIDMFFQITQGFSYLHKFNIIHRDLKPTNILIHNGVYKIADFGVARTEQLHKSLIHNDLIGVPIYMSPQILSKNFYSYKCDVWSLGIIMFEFYFKKLPWKGQDVNSLFFQIMTNPTPYLEQGKTIPGLIKTIFNGTLQYLQKQRMSWEELLTLKNRRKKIFDDLSKSKPNSYISSGHQPPYTSLSSSTTPTNSSIPSFEAELLHHIICQYQSLHSQLTTLLGQQCYSTYVNTIKKYLSKGQSYKQCFIDCGFFLLKIAGENLHMYMIDLDILEQARPLLILLELIHDITTMPIKVSQQEFKKIISKSYRNSKIQEYAASVISKINTYRLGGIPIQN